MYFLYYLDLFFKIILFNIFILLNNSFLKLIILILIYFFFVLIKLEENDNKSNFIPIRILTSWNKVMSIFFITMADTSRVHSNYLVIRKSLQ